MKTFIYLASALLWLTAQSVFSQAISLDDCLSLSRENYPLHGDLASLDKQIDLRLKSLNANYYPQFDLTGQVTWQNDVPGITNPLVNMPKAPQDQYKAFVDVQQVIYDGGRTRTAKDAELNSKLVQQNGLEVELYKLRTRVIESYFMVLLIDEQLAQVEYRNAVINQRWNELKSAVASGMVLQSEADQLEVSLLLILQDRYRLEEGRKSALSILSELVGQNMPQNQVLETPFISNGLHIRPEYSYFDAQRQQLTLAQKMSSVNRMPSLFAFGQVGYGNPSYNMLKDEFDSFYMVGVKLKWTIWDWNKASNDKQIYQLKSEGVLRQQETFDKNIRLTQSDVDARISYNFV